MVFSISVQVEIFLFQRRLTSSCDLKSFSSGWNFNPGWISTRLHVTPPPLPPTAPHDKFKMNSKYCCDQGTCNVSIILITMTVRCQQDLLFSSQTCLVFESDLPCFDSNFPCLDLDLSIFWVNKTFFLRIRPAVFLNWTFPVLTQTFRVYIQTFSFFGSVLPQASPSHFSSQTFPLLRVRPSLFSELVLLIFRVRPSHFLGQSFSF